MNRQSQQAQAGARIVGHTLPALRVLSPWLFILMGTCDVRMSEEAKTRTGHAHTCLLTKFLLMSMYLLSEHESDCTCSCCSSHLRGSELALRNDMPLRLSWWSQVLGSLRGLAACRHLVLARRAGPRRFCGARCRIFENINAIQSEVP